MSSPIPAFTTSLHLSNNNTTSTSFIRPLISPITPCTSTTSQTIPNRRLARMEAGETTEPVTSTIPAPTSITESDVNISWPPPEMSSEWAEAIERLVRAVPNTSRQSADIALEETDGDENEALTLLMDSNWSDVRRQREMAVEKARAAGDVNRVSAVKEAELRRKATGSAQDFFKAYVETEGSYVDAGYVDEDADAIGKVMKGFKNLFGRADNKKKE